MPLELECKVRVSSHDAVRERLKIASARFVCRVLETNRLFDDGDSTLLQKGCGLRIRSIQTLEGEGPAATLTFKGPLQPGDFKRREEIEIGIEDAEKMTDFLHALGYREHLTFEKRRESWLLGGCKVELDEVPRLGCFVEIEAESDAAIHQTMYTLNITGLPSIHQSYAALIAHAAGSPAARPIISRFNS